ncbi:MAG: hypothetical protein IT426_16530 [Pirellulales bacterium]|nr:hypothetical protein [Pirellulales bacterium]
MKRFLLMLLIAAMAIGTQGTWAMADDSSATTQKPVAVVSLAGYDAFMGDVHYVAKLAGNPELGAGLEGLLKLFTKNQGLVGLDKARPWGAVLNFEGEKLTGYAFLPVTDLAKLGDALEGVIGKTEDLGGGVHKIRGKNRQPPMFVKEGKNWAFFADSQDKLTNLPDDPAALLGGLEKQYQVAVRFNAGNVPENLRQKLVAEMENGAQRDAAKRRGESDEEHALRLKLTAEVVKYLKKVVGELQDVTLGWNLDTTAEKCYFEANVVAKPGTELAKASESLRNAHSRFAGFGGSDAAIVGNVNGQLPAFKTDLLKEIFDAVRKRAIEDIEKKEHDAAKAEAGKQFVDKLLPLVQDSIANGRVDKGMAVVLEPRALTVVAGGALVNNGRIEEMAKLVLDAVKKDHPEMADNLDQWVKLNAEKFAGITLHTVSIPIPTDAKDRAKIVSLIGETLEVVIGTGDDSAYVAAGRDPLAALKKAIEQSAADAAKTVPPLEFTVSLSKVAEFVAAVGQPRERPRAEKLAAALKQSSGGDRMILRAQAIDNGVQYRLEIEPGVLQAFAKMR